MDQRYCISGGTFTENLPYGFTSNYNQENENLKIDLKINCLGKMIISDLVLTCTNQEAINVTKNFKQLSDYFNTLLKQCEVLQILPNSKDIYEKIIQQVEGITGQKFNQSYQRIEISFLIHTFIFLLQKKFPQSSYMKDLSDLFTSHKKEESSSAPYGNAFSRFFKPIIGYSRMSVEDDSSIELMSIYFQNGLQYTLRNSNSIFNNESILELNKQINEDILKLCSKINGLSVLLFNELKNTVDLNTKVNVVNQFIESEKTTELIKDYFVLVHKKVSPDLMLRLNTIFQFLNDHYQIEIPSLSEIGRIKNIPTIPVEKS